MPGFFDAVKQLLTTGSVSFNETSTVGKTVSTSMEKTFGSATPAAWGSTSGSLTNSSQNIQKTEIGDEFIGQIKGEGTGQIGTLSGSTFIELAEVPPGASAISMQIKLTVGRGRVEVSICTPDGEILSDTASENHPATLNGVSEISMGRLRMKLAAIDGAATDLSYDVKFAST